LPQQGRKRYPVPITLLSRGNAGLDTRWTGGDIEAANEWITTVAAACLALSGEHCPLQDAIVAAGLSVQ
jgi:hypothetical protein